MSVVVSFQIYAWCVCPSGLVSDGKGGCVKEDQCPCYHNGAQYKPGDSIKVDCNKWYVHYSTFQFLTTVQMLGDILSEHLSLF